MMESGGSLIRYITLNFSKLFTRGKKSVTAANQEEDVPANETDFWFYPITRKFFPFAVGVAIPISACIFYGYIGSLNSQCPSLFVTNGRRFGLMCMTLLLLPSIKYTQPHLYARFGTKNQTISKSKRITMKIFDSRLNDLYSVAIYLCFISAYIGVLNSRTVFGANGRKFGFAFLLFMALLSSMKYLKPHLPEIQIFGLPKSKRITLKEFDSRLNELKRSYPFETLSNNVWIVISTTAEKLLAESEPRCPGVFFILKRKSSSSDFEIGLGELFSSSLRASTEINPLQLNQDYFNDTKSVTEVKRGMTNYFSSGGHVIIIRNVDQIEKWEKLNLFHAFCDTDFADPKRACFIFTATIPQGLNIEQKPASLLNVILDEAWAHVSVDIRKALISRVGCCPIVCP